METKFASEDSILVKLSENFTSIDSEKESMVFTSEGGGGTFCNSLPDRAKKCLLCIGLKQTCTESRVTFFVVSSSRHFASR